jgi:hypothetical protein
MKWAFYLLLVVNVAFFTWQQTQEPGTAPAPRPTPRSQAGDKSIRLLHEVDKNANSLADVMESGNARSRRAAEPAKPAARPAEPEPVAPIRETPPALTEIEKQVAALDARRAQRSEAAVATREANERANQRRIAEAERVTTPPPAREEPVPEKRTCYTAGPIADQANAEAVQTRLENLGIVARKRTEEIAGKTQYWVLDVTRDERAAQQRLMELRKKNVNDADIVREGEYENMISLGKYPQERDATARVNKLVKLGFRPVVEKIDNVTTRYWIDFEETSRSGPDATQWREVTAGIGRVEKKERACR